jgi:hypothetical protein
VDATHVVECFWPGVHPADLDALDARAADAVAALRREGIQVAYRGSWLLREDEVVLCFFDGTRDEVTAAARRAAIPYERVQQSIHAAGIAGRAGPDGQPDPGPAQAEGPVRGG